MRGGRDRGHRCARCQRASRPSCWRRSPRPCGRRKRAAAAVTYPGGDPLAGLDANRRGAPGLSTRARRGRGGGARRGPGRAPGLRRRGIGPVAGRCRSPARRDRRPALDARHEPRRRSAIGEDIVAATRPAAQRARRSWPAPCRGSRRAPTREDSYWRGDEAAAAAARDPLGRYAGRLRPSRRLRQVLGQVPHTRLPHHHRVGGGARLSRGGDRLGGHPAPAAPRTPASTPPRSAWRTSREPG